MVTIALYASLGIIALALLSWIPGVKVLVSPIIGLITKLVEETFKHSLGYIIWAVKLVLVSHLDFLKNLTHSRKHFNPTEDFEDE